jgi:tetratricopeptide (TPR) repeat protein
MANPTLWNVPYKQNRYFTGREDTLLQLHRALSDINTVGLTHTQGISGLGGIGKTQTAVEFAYRYGIEYDAVFWVRADSLTALFAGFVEIARLLQLPERREQDQRIIVEAVLRWLRLHARWLLIFDNMDDLTLTQPFLPLANRGHILFTTRARAFENLAQRVEIRQMEQETGALLLLRRAELIPLQAMLNRAVSKDRDLACTISREMDGLPLALDQAGAYIKETPSTLVQYLLLYQQRREDLLKIRGANSQDYPAPVATTWSLSFEKVTQANPATTDLLTLCAFLAPDAIPETIFRLGAPYLGDLLKPVAANEHQFNLACREALRYSLIAREGDDETLTMHRLVQTVLRENTPEKKQGGWRLMPASFSKHKTIVTRKEWKERAVLAVNAAGPNVQDVEEWPACEVWTPHALICADWIEQEHLYYDQSANILNKAGYYLEYRARYKEAEPLYQKCISICKQQFGSRHLHTAQVFNNLGALYYRQGKYKEAEQLHQQALAIREKQAGSMHLATANSLNNLGILYPDKTMELTLRL